MKKSIIGATGLLLLFGVVLVQITCAPQGSKRSRRKNGEAGRVYGSRRRLQ